MTPSLTVHAWWRPSECYTLLQSCYLQKWILSLAYFVRIPKRNDFFWAGLDPSIVQGLSWISDHLAPAGVEVHILCLFILGNGNQHRRQVVDWVIAIGQISVIPHSLDCCIYKGSEGSAYQWTPWKGWSLWWAMSVTATLRHCSLDATEVFLQRPSKSCR